MAAGFSPTLANSMLGLIGPWWVQLHTDRPGTDGTHNVASIAIRKQITWNAPSAGSLTAANAPSWGLWNGVSPQVITFLSFWDSMTGGIFKFSLAVIPSLNVLTGTPVVLAGLTLTITPQAA